MRITRKRRIWATSRLTKIVGSVIDFCLGYPEIGVAKSPHLSSLKSTFALIGDYEPGGLILRFRVSTALRTL